jgi:undecaprenyl-diphosphatase
VAGLVLLVLGLLLGIAASGPGVLPGDLDLLRWVQQPRSEWLDHVAWDVSRIGDGWPAMTLLAIAAVGLLLFLGRRDLAFFIGLAAAMRAVGPTLKTLADSARPPTDLVMATEPSKGLGFPSGHALGAALFYGAIAVITPEAVHNRVAARVIQGVAVTMILLTAWARVRLGVHWPSDVMGAVLIGFGLVFLLRGAQLGWHERAAMRSDMASRETRRS